ncbi:MULTISPECIES: hypothetical protein [Paracoccaceae]|jgi:hypothetical protein|uniref:hypothetical protein n=1 Tax=Rhodobacterales TaxID=204455 RepID=UPI001D0A541E|nr:hypothetical protein [Boseongicola sp. H5]
MKPVVMRSINDATGQRCVDILGTDGGAYWSECRRDPEDAHGWRRLDAPRGPYADETAAVLAARDAVGWMKMESDG